MLWSAGQRLHYVVAGQGPAVVLLHGFPETHASFALQMPALVAAGFRVAALDLRGYGASDRPRRGYDLRTLAADVSALADELGPEPVRLVGHDWGGAITWYMASHRPWRLERAVVIDCPHPDALARALRSNLRQLRRSWYMFFFQLPVLPELWLASAGGAPIARMFRDQPGPPEIVEAEQKALLEPGALRAALAYYRTAFREQAPSLLTGRQLRSPRIDLPMTLIWGEHDSCLGLELIEDSRRYASNLDVHVVPSAGHFVHQECPELVNSILVQALAAKT